MCQAPRGPFTLNSLDDVARDIKFCPQHLSVVKADLSQPNLTTAVAKMRNFMTVKGNPFLIVVRRYGRSHIIRKRAGEILFKMSIPYMNTLCLQDNPIHVQVYLQAYARDPSSWIIVPKGASVCTNFLSHASSRVLTGSSLLHVMDDNLKSVVFAGTGMGGKALRVTRVPFLNLLEAGEQAVQEEQALSWGVTCYQGRSWEDAPTNPKCERWWKVRERFLSYTSYPRLLFGGFFALKPWTSPNMDVPKSFGPQDDVARSVLHGVLCQKVVIFKRVIAWKTQFEPGGCQNSGGLSARKATNDWIRARLLSWGKKKVKNDKHKRGMELVRAWWRRSKFLRAFLK